jgi:hypothetical protein
MALWPLGASMSQSALATSESDASNVTEGQPLKVSLNAYISALSIISTH